MGFENVHPVVLIVWSAAVATAGIFAWLTVSNLVSLRVFEDPALRLYAAFTAWGIVDALAVAASFLPLDPVAKTQVFRLMWISGPLCMALWMRSVAQFVDAADHRLLRSLSALLMAIAGLWAADMAWTFAGARSMFYRLEPRGTRSLLRRAAGDVFSHRPLADVAVVGVIVLVLIGAGVLLVLVRRRRPGEWLLQVGVVTTGVFGVVQAVLAGTDSAYNVPLLFMSNLVEAMRITWVSRAQLGEELAAVRAKQAEQSILIDHQLEQLQLSTRMASLGQRTAEVTHDLRNPLGAVLAGLELAGLELDEPEPDAGQVRESLALARASLEHSLTLVRRITSQARPSAPSKPRALALRALVDDAISLCRHRSAGVDVDLEIDAGLEVFGRSTDLIQLFMNLISNACEAMDGLAAPRVEIRAARSGALVRVEVEDAGPRPRDRLVAQMFKERFTTRASADGTGLGLIICARIVKQHGGTIAVDPARACTTIVISLPGC